jgi:hypothetical protein
MLTLRKRGKIFHIRGTIRVGLETRLVKEHSVGTDRRDVADAYRSKLEVDIRHEILHGRSGRTHSLTIADAGLRYIARSGGVRAYDLARLDRINRIVGASRKRPRPGRNSSARDVAVFRRPLCSVTAQHSRLRSITWRKRRASLRPSCRA